MDNNKRHWKNDISGDLYLPSTTILPTRNNPNYWKPILVVLLYLFYSPSIDAFSYPDTQKITLEVKRNDEEANLVSSDGVKNQAVLL